MSTNVFPSLSGVEFPVTRTPMWNTIVQEAVSGARVAVGLWSYPRYAWELSYSYLPSSNLSTGFGSLVGFFNSMYGRQDTFLYTDADDYSVSSQSIGTGNGATSTYQLVRTLGGFTEPVLAPNTITSVSVAGTPLGSSAYSVQGWGSTAPGVLTFSSAPSGALTASFSYYFPVRFDDDQMSFELFLKQIYANRSVKFSSEKL